MTERRHDVEEKRVEAVGAYQHSIRLADERKMPESDQKYIKERIQAVEAL